VSSIATFLIRTMILNKIIQLDFHRREFFCNEQDWPKAVSAVLNIRSFKNIFFELSYYHLSSAMQFSSL